MAWDEKGLAVENPRNKLELHFDCVVIVAKEQKVGSVIATNLL